MDDKQPEPTTPALVPIRDAAVLLSVSRRTVERLIADGQLPCVRVGLGSRKRTFIKRVEIHRFIERNTERR